MLNSWVFIIVSSLAMLLGGGLVIKGIWPRRTGDAPHCRRCGYNLTGSTGAICPECGRALNARSTVQGERKRRPGRIAAELILLLIGGIGPGSSLIATNWYPYLPSSWLIADLSSPTRGADAWQELMNREVASGLGGWSRAKLIEICLAAQGAAPPGPLADKQVEYLGSGWRAKQLTQAQGEKFLRQMVTPSLEIRQRVRVGSVASWNVTGRRCMPESFLYQLSKARILDNGRVAVEEQPNLAQIQQYGSDHPLLPVPCEQIGHHDVTLEATAEIYIDPYGPGVTNMSGPPPEGEPCIRFPVKLSATYEGIPADVANIKRVADPSLQEGIRSSQRPTEFVVKDGYHAESESWRRMLTPHSWRSSGSLPANVAFKMFARVGEREYEIGETSGRQGNSMCLSGGGAPYSGPVPKTVDLILRPSEQVARKTLDLYEIWDGEIVYESVPVSSELPAKVEQTQAVGEGHGRTHDRRRRAK